MCDVENYDVVFNAIAQGVIGKAQVPCEYFFPEVEGVTIDPNTIQIHDTPGDGSEPQTFTQVPVGQCAPGDAHFYIEHDKIKLCHATCQLLKKDNAAAVKILYGCKSEHP